MTAVPDLPADIVPRLRRMFVLIDIGLLPMEDAADIVKASMIDAANEIELLREAIQALGAHAFSDGSLDLEQDVADAVQRALGNGSPAATES